MSGVLGTQLSGDFSQIRAPAAHPEAVDSQPGLALVVIEEPHDAVGRLFGLAHQL